MSLFQLQDANQPVVFYAAPTTDYSVQPVVSPAPATTSPGPSVGVKRFLNCGACSEAGMGVVGGRDMRQRYCVCCTGLME